MKDKNCTPKDNNLCTKQYSFYIATPIQILDV